MNEEPYRATIMEEEVLANNRLCKVLGFGASVQYLKDCGLRPYMESPKATYWLKADVNRIRRAVAERLLKEAGEPE